MRNRKRWFQIRLSTMLILICMAGFLIGSWTDEYVKHQKALEWLSENDGEVLEWEHGLLYDYPTKVCINGLVDNIGPIQEFSELRSLRVCSGDLLEHPYASVSDFTPIQNLTKLREICIKTGEKVVLPSGDRLRNLKSIFISSPQFVDLSRFKTYRDLDTISLIVLMEVSTDQAAVKHPIAYRYEPKKKKETELVPYIRELNELRRTFPNTAVESACLECFIN